MTDIVERLWELCAKLPPGSPDRAVVVEAADLIAAAPDLLTALEKIVGAAEHCGDADAPVVIQAREAIAKATGDA